MIITNLEATFDKGKGSIAFDIEDGVVEDLGAVLNLITSFVKHPSNELHVEDN
jgi:hypothetical protein